MLSFPNCKINLGLFVTARRADGYHDLETVFYPVPVRDVLEVVPAATAALHMTGLGIAGKSENNLVWKAYQLLQGLYPTQVPPLAIYLHKVIPMGAGLGGGSADGAFMLRLLNDYCQLGLSKEQLAAYALQLGSDCPFFIENTPMFGSGRGEMLVPSPVSLAGYSLQLICPSIHVSTADAFGFIKARPAPFDLRLLHTLPVADWKGVVSNDFETPVFERHPALHHIQQQLYSQGALYASMTGTGAAVYGIFPRGERATVTTQVAVQTFYVD